MTKTPFKGLPVAVPSDFMGMALVEHPVIGPNPSGVLPYRSVRLMFAKYSKWYEIETSQGVYDQSVLAGLDSIITANRQNGANVIFGFNGTPLFYAQTAPNPVVGDNVTKGPGNVLGECSYPTSLAAVDSFVRMIVTRYNLPGGAWYDANGATLGKGIQYWETGNEPPWDTRGNRATASGQKITSINFWGTDAQMVDLMQTQYSAIKSLDKSIEVLAPGLSNHTAENNYKELDACFNTLGTVTGKRGYESFDSFAWHPYYTCPPGRKYGEWGAPWIGDMVTGPLGVFNVAGWMRKRGFTHKLHATEWGFDTYSATNTSLAWRLESSEFRYRWLTRTIMCAAAGGVASIHPWHWNITGTNIISGDWQNDVDGAQRAYKDCSARLPGKTITAGYYVFDDGTVSLTFADGSTWTV